MSLTNVKLTAEQATAKLLLRDWLWVEGYWRPSALAVEDKPEIIPGNYTLSEALAFYGFTVEED